MVTLIGSPSTKFIELSSHIYMIRREAGRKWVAGTQLAQLDYFLEQRQIFEKI